MDYLSWALINGPLSIISFIINVFYIFCMVRPLHGERIKQPLKLLLSSLVGTVSLYMLGTTLNLGAGQCFRQRAADVWGRAGQWCRSLQQR
ncbi:LOW QUALITY PROTEIN: taste receptor, type 2, member 201, tandem duplicate 1 [Fundulus diaphanus]